jgi:hypothetical protein
MKLHGLRVGKRQRQCRANASRRADRAEQVCRFVALIGGLSRAGSPSGPLPDNAVLLADTSLILEPYLDRRVFGQTGQVRA